MNEIGLIGDDTLQADRVRQAAEAKPFDVQVNGFAGVDFNDPGLTVTAIGAACESLRDTGVGEILATVITAPIETMRTCIATIRKAVEADAKVAEMIRGIHVEGPFINPEPGYVGAHPVDAVRPADVDVCQDLIDVGGGLIRLWTLAPEVDSNLRVTRFLSGQNIRVSAGHTNASIEQLRAAIDAGLSMVTHLGNGCPAQLHRHDNIIQRVLGLPDRLWISFIADGHHIPWFALRNYLRCVPEDRIIIVSDCISAAGLGPGTHRLGAQKVIVEDSLATWSEDRTHFAGSATSLPRMIELLSAQTGVTNDQIHAYTSLNPRRLLSDSK